MRVDITYPHKPQYYGPLGVCIYCGDDGRDSGGLTKEHAVPFALDGSVVVRAASCEKCRKITREIENANFHGTNSNFGTFLLQDNYQSRRPKKKPRPTHLPITVSTPSHTIYRKVPIKERPPVLVLPEMGEPGILIGRDIGAPFPFQLRLMGPWDQASFAERQGGAITVDVVKFNHEAFLRLLAKMVHCLAVLTYGMDGFTPLLPDFILGEKPELAGYLIGQSKHFPAVPHEEVEKHKRRHAIAFRTLPTLALSGASVQLFSRYPTPTYCVIAGKFTPDQLARRERSQLLPT